MAAATGAARGSASRRRASTRRRPSTWPSSSRPRESQLAAFKAAGNLPSNPKLYEDPALKDAKNDYFNNAPVGELFVAGAANLKPVYLGAKNQPVRDAVENVMRSVEGGQRSAAEGWSEAIKAAEKAAK